MGGPTRPASNVFLNVPFDSSYQRSFIALVTGLVGLGLTPRCVLELDPGQARLARILELIRECRYSVHDLSAVKLSHGPFRVPRFNMPFELGLAVAVSAADPERHQFRILERVRHRMGQSLSDMSGHDPVIHGGTIKGMLAAVLDAFAELPAPPLQSVNDLVKVYQQVRGIPRASLGNVFSRAGYARLVVLARLATESLQVSK